MDSAGTTVSELRLVVAIAVVGARVPSAVADETASGTMLQADAYVGASTTGERQLVGTYLGVAQSLRAQAESAPFIGGGLTLRDTWTDGDVSRTSLGGAARIGWAWRHTNDPISTAHLHASAGAFIVGDAKAEDSMSRMHGRGVRFSLGLTVGAWTRVYGSGDVSVLEYVRGMFSHVEVETEMRWHAGGRDRSVNVLVGFGL